MNSKLPPKEIRKLSEHEIQVTWADNSINQITSEVLRKLCPCAVCKAERGDTSHEKPLSPKKSSLSIVESTREESVELKTIRGVGNYAIALEWGDRHDDGIYTWPYLLELVQS